MSDIDNEARDVLKDVILYRAPVSFLASGLKSIARFTMKNALVADYMYHRPFFSERQRRQFKESHELPLGIYAWFGGVAPDRRKRHGIYKAVYGKPAAAVRRGVEAYVFTWSTEWLLLQLAAVRWTNLLDQSRGWPRLTQRCIKMNTAMCPFWPVPVSRRATWPPQQYISHNDLDEFADRFTGVQFVD